MAKFKPTLKRLKMPLWQKLSIYLVVALLFTSGAIWLVFHWGLMSEVNSNGGDFQSQNYKRLAMQIHGSASLVALVIFGSLLTHHIQVGWRLNTHRLSGSINIITIAILTLSTALLWYGKLGVMRDIGVYAHWLFGLLLPITIFFHRYGAVRQREPHF
jgi:hypothetical protein